MRPDRIGLKNHADISLIRYDEDSIAGVEDGSAAQLDLAALRPLQARDASESRCFATAGGSEESKKLALLDGKTDIVNRMNRRCAAYIELFGQVLNLELVILFNW